MWKRSVQKIQLFQASDDLVRLGFNPYVDRIKTHIPQQQVDNGNEDRPPRLQGLFSKVVDLRSSRDVAKRAAASLLEAKKQPQRPAGGKPAIVKQASFEEEGAGDPYDPYDEMYGGERGRQVEQDPGAVYDHWDGALRTGQHHLH